MKAIQLLYVANTISKKKRIAKQEEDEKVKVETDAREVDDCGDDVSFLYKVNLGRYSYFRKFLL